MTNVQMAALIGVMYSLNDQWKDDKNLSKMAESALKWMNEQDVKLNKEKSK